MTQEQMHELVRTIINQPQVRPELKLAGEVWLGDANHDTWVALVEAAKKSIATIDETIGFFSSEDAKNIFGQDIAEKMLAHAKDVKAHGGQFCDCSACNPTLTIIEHAEEF